MEYKRIVQDSDTAILFIHGIVGTPNHFLDFVKLVPQHVSLYNMLLDGHGKGPKDFADSSMKKWEQQVQNAVDELSLTHNRIYIVAHSMGTLLAIEQAVKNAHVAKLFLLAVPLKLFLKPAMAINSLKVYFGRISPTDLAAQAAKNCYGIQDDKNPFHYIGWIPRFFELFAKNRYTRKILNQLRTPCFAYQSAKDEMVSLRSISYLAQNPCISVSKLKNSGHYYYDNNDHTFLLSEFKKFIDDIPC